MKDKSRCFDDIGSIRLGKDKSALVCAIAEYTDKALSILTFYARHFRVH